MDDHELRVARVAETFGECSLLRLNSHDEKEKQKQGGDFSQHNG